MSNNSIIEVNTENAPDVLREIEEAYFDIPFGNSDFQTRAFVLAQQITPERVYRQIGLELSNLLQSLKSIEYAKKLYAINREEKLEKLNDVNTNKWEKKRLQLELDSMESNSYSEQKSLKDTLRQLNLLYAEFKKFPKYTREQFEAAEENHYTQSMERMVKGIQGPVENLINIVDDMPALERFKNNYLGLSEADDKKLEELRLSMDNQLKNTPVETQEKSQLGIKNG